MATTAQRLISLPVAAPGGYFSIEKMDDDGIPATLAEAKEWTRIAMWTHTIVLLVQPNRSQLEKDWDSMWVVRYKKILQRLEFYRD